MDGETHSSVRFLLGTAKVEVNTRIFENIGFPKAKDTNWECGYKGLELLVFTCANKSFDVPGVEL